MSVLSNDQLKDLAFLLFSTLILSLTLWKYKFVFCTMAILLYSKKVELTLTCLLISVCFSVSFVLFLLPFPPQPLLVTALLTSSAIYKEPDYDRDYAEFGVMALKVKFSRLSMLL